MLTHFFRPKKRVALMFIPNLNPSFMIMIYSYLFSIASQISQYLKKCFEK